MCGRAYLAPSKLRTLARACVARTHALRVSDRWPAETFARSKEKSEVRSIANQPDLDSVAEPPAHALSLSLSLSLSVSFYISLCLFPSSNKLGQNGVERTLLLLPLLPPPSPAPLCTLLRLRLPPLAIGRTPPVRLRLRAHVSDSILLRNRLMNASRRATRSAPAT